MFLKLKKVSPSSKCFLKSLILVYNSTLRFLPKQSPAKKSHPPPDPPQVYAGLSCYTNFRITHTTHNTRFLPCVNTNTSNNTSQKKPNLVVFRPKIFHKNFKIFPKNLKKISKSTKKDQKFQKFSK